MNLEDAVTRALADAELDESHRSLVLSLYGQADDSWRLCCGSDCRPCSTQLAIAVDRIRELLERP